MVMFEHLFNKKRMLTHTPSCQSINNIRLDLLSLPLFLDHTQRASALGTHASSTCALCTHARLAIARVTAQREGPVGGRGLASAPLGVDDVHLGRVHAHRVEAQPAVAGVVGLVFEVKTPVLEVQ